MPTLSDDPREREAEEKCLADIEQYGVHVLKVSGDDEWPAFTYSVGLFACFAIPEIIILGLRSELAHSIINQIADRARSGERFALGDKIDGVIEGFTVVLNPVSPEFVEPHFGWDMWFYGNAMFPVAQLVFPTTKGIWPWDTGASEAFKRDQPLLDRVAVPAWARESS